MRLKEIVGARFDSFVNFATGLGSYARDKLMQTQFQNTARLTPQALEYMYMGDDIAARICEALPESASRKWAEIQPDDSEDTEAAQKIEKALKALGLKGAALEAAIWGRVLGGAVLYIGIDDGQDVSEPVNEAQIRSIKFLTVLTKQEIRPYTYQTDPALEGFGKVQTYEIQALEGIGLKIHSSRVLVLGGARTTKVQKKANGGWDDSVLHKVHDVLVQFASGWQATAHLMTDAAQGVFKIQDLAEILASGDSTLLQTRMEIMDSTRSVSRAIMVDAENEDFERKAYNFSGVPGVLDKFMLRLAAAARMPVTKLMGQSPAGMNATGASDLDLWDGEAQTYQDDVFTPIVQRMAYLVSIAKDTRVDLEDFSVVWPKIRNTSEKEQAEIEKLTADKDVAYITAQVLLPEEVALSRYGNGEFSAHTSIDVEARAEILAADAAASKLTDDPEPEPDAT
ncbi:MAG: DUF1073 domain-containing protein [Deltaproteobacteria bacterium]|nr:DUF1073 domain-containing protein [Deltaproteobacteria bacterium]